MSESVQVSEEFHAFLESRRRDGETMEETLRRLVGRPRRAADESGQTDADESGRTDAGTPERTGPGESERADLTGPHPEEVAGIITSETAEKMRERIERSGERDAAARRELRERFE